MRIFGDPQRTKALLSRAGMREGEAIESRLLSRQIERAQRKVEAHNRDAMSGLAAGLNLPEGFKMPF